MEIDTRFPAVQVNQVNDGRDGQNSTPPPALVESDSKFFISPVLRFDSRSLTVSFQVRDSLSGDVVRQFPSEAVIARYRQDPTTKPFVLPSSRDDAEGDALDVKIGGPVAAASREDAGYDGPQAAPIESSTAEPARTAPVDLVA